MLNRIDALRGEIDELIRHIDRRRKIAIDVAQFFASANAVCFIFYVISQSFI